MDRWSEVSMREEAVSISPFPSSPSLPCILFDEYAMGGLDDNGYEMSPEVYVSPDKPQTGLSVLATLELQESCIPFDCLDLEEKIGQGFFGAVYRGALKLVAGGREPCAVKAITRKKYKGRSQEDIFLKEVECLSRVVSETCIDFFGVSVDTKTGQFYIVTEFMEGGSLRDTLDSVRKGHVANLSWAAKLQVMLDIAKALADLHGEDIIHRDLSSSNVLLTKGLDHAKVADFGLSRAVARDGAMTAGTGAIVWMAPEVMTGEAYGTKIDVYSFGLLLWELLSLQTPEGLARTVWAQDGAGVDHISLNAAVTASVGDLNLPCALENCKAMMPQDRPEMRDIAGELMELADRLSVMGSPSGWGEEYAWETARKRLQPGVVLASGGTESARARKKTRRRESTELV